jgi:hypothetical protein
MQEKHKFLVISKFLFSFKGLFTGLSLIALFLAYIQIISPSIARAEEVPPGTVIDLTNYITPTTDQSAQISSGEIFSTRKGKNPGEYIQCKNADCSSFQKIFMTSNGFAIQGENYWEGDGTTFQYRTESGGQATWLPKSMKVGDTWSSGPMDVVGYNLNPDGSVGSEYKRYKTDGVSMRFNSLKTYTYNGKTYKIAIMEVVAGPGAGEKFWYAEGIGWVGWENGGTHNILEGIIDGLGNLEPFLIANSCGIGDVASKRGKLRPKPCRNCSLEVDKPAQTCAESPILIKRISYSCSPSGPSECGEPITHTNFSAGMTVNADDAVVPFVGFKDIKKDGREGRSSNLNNYLADYFEGTAYYDGEKYDPGNNEQNRNLVWETGVFRKLSTIDDQNEQKIDMIKKGYDYEVTDGELSARMNEWKSQPYAYNGTTGRFPPDKNDPNYEENKEKWLKTKYGKLWNYVPLFTREDAPGKMIVKIAHDPGKISLPDGVIGKQIDDHTIEYPVAFPHIARLYEATKKIHEIITQRKEEEVGENRQTYTPNKVIIATDQRPQTADTIRTSTTTNASNCSPSVGDNINLECKADNIVRPAGNIEYDTLCSKSSFNVDVSNYVVKKNCDGEIEDYDPLSGLPIYKTKSTTARRGVEVRFEIPYLEEIWKFTGSPESGFFHEFRPKEIEKFPEAFAETTVFYETGGDVSVSLDKGADGGSAKVEGKLYYPYLGGIQKAKKCVSETMLTPTEMQGADQCKFSDNFSL